MLFICFNLIIDICSFFFYHNVDIFFSWVMPFGVIKDCLGKGLKDSLTYSDLLHV